MARILVSAVSFFVAFYYASTATRGFLTIDDSGATAESPGNSPWDSLPSPRANHGTIHQGMLEAQYANRHNEARFRQITNAIQDQNYGRGNGRRSDLGRNPYTTGVGNTHKPKRKPAKPASKGKVTSNPYAGS